MNKLNIQHCMPSVKHAATVAIHKQTYFRFFNTYDPLNRNLKTSQESSGTAFAYTLVDNIEHAEVNTDVMIKQFNCSQSAVSQVIQVQLESM